MTLVEHCRQLWHRRNPALDLTDCLKALNDCIAKAYGETDARERQVASVNHLLEDGLIIYPA
jgi:hypothetical protein